MAFKQHTYPLRIAPVTSKYLMVIIACVYCLSLCSVAWSPLPWVFNLSITVALLLSFACSLKRYRRSVLLVWETPGDWRVSVDNKPGEVARLLGSSIVNRYFIWLHLRSERNRFIALVLARDALPADVFRRLRVRLLIDARKENTRHALMSIK